MEMYGSSETSKVKSSVESPVGSNMFSEFPLKAQCFSGLCMADSIWITKEGCIVGRDQVSMHTSGGKC